MNLKRMVKNTSFGQNFVRPISDKLLTDKWISAGRFGSSPGAIKVRNILCLADVFGCDTLVETGTHYGDTVVACLKRFSTIHSIEIYEPLGLLAQQKFKHNPHVRIHIGDSATVLPLILTQLPGPTVFWLDGHCSGAGTGQGSMFTPVLAEIEEIARLREGANDVVIIDDARLFRKEENYPDLPDFLATIEKLFHRKPRVACDAIMILPA